MKKESKKFIGETTACVVSMDSTKHKHLDSKKEWVEYDAHISFLNTNCSNFSLTYFGWDENSDKEINQSIKDAQVVAKQLETYIGYLNTIKELRTKDKGNKPKLKVKK